MNDSVKEKIIEEAKRLEINSLYSFKGHFNASDSWGKRHYWLGIPATIGSTIAGASIFAEVSGCWAYIAGTAGVVAAILAGTSTFLDPNKQARLHNEAGATYKLIRDKARILHQIKCISDMPDTELTAELEKLVNEHNECGKKYPVIPPRAYNKAKKGIEAGEADYP